MAGFATSPRTAFLSMTINAGLGMVFVRLTISSCSHQQNTGFTFCRTTVDFKGFSTVRVKEGRKDPLLEKVIILNRLEINSNCCVCMTTIVFLQSFLLELIQVFLVCIWIWRRISTKVLLKRKCAVWQFGD